ncbi:Rmf/CrpP family protein [Phaeobacter sp. JH20_36]|uniref:ribosome modulation factor n=1 Tax=unclassified Phaeobacter TaxID=2621772 RepID=UPI003A8401BC
MSSNELTPTQRMAQQVADVKSFDPGLGSYNFAGLSDVVKFSEVMCKAGEMLPQHLQNKPALCMAVTMRATHWGFDPFALAMETYQAKSGGIIGYQAKVFTAALRNAGVKLRYRYEGRITILDKPVRSHKGNQVAARTATGDRKCIAYWVDVDGAELTYETMTLDQITIKNSPLWHNDPDSQLAYAAGRGWARRYRSDVMMGAYSSDEVEEMKPIRDVTPESEASNGFAARATRARQSDQSTEAKAPDDETSTLDGEILPADEDAAPVEQEQQEDGGTTERTFEHDEGATAFTQGKTASDCPHEDDPQRTNWMAGWNEAYNAAEQEGGDA